MDVREALILCLSQAALAVALSLTTVAEVHQLIRLNDNDSYIGLGTAIFYAGFAGIAAAVPAMLRRFAPRVVLAGSFLAAIILVAIERPLLAGPFFLVVQLGLGGAAAGAIVTLNVRMVQASSHDRRGLAIGALHGASYLGWIVGPVIAASVNEDGVEPFAVGVIGLALSVPFFAGLRPLGALGQRGPAGSQLIQTLLANPALMAIALIASSPAFGLLPIGGERGLSLPAGEAATLLSWFFAGSMLMTPLFGGGGDRLGHLHLLIAAALACGACCATVGTGALPLITLQPVVFLIGGFYGGTVALGLAMGTTLVVNSQQSDFVAAWSVMAPIGALVGSVAAGMAMSAAGSLALFFVIGLSSVALVPIAIFAARNRDGRSPPIVRRKYELQ